jgi:hypothetical protein
MRQVALFLLIFSMALAACTARTDESPTPFPTAATSLTPAGEGPVILTITELAAAPGLYQDTVVQLTGLLRKQPVVVCDKDYHPSPASWGLAEGGILILAGGFDQQVRPLLPDDLQMTVEGRWRRWQGVVGCGKGAQPREVWYLDVARILSPSPLTQVTLTPGAGEATVVTELLPTQTPEGTGGLEPSPVATLAETPEAPGATVPSGSYPGPNPIATLPSEQNPTATTELTPSATSTGAAVTPTPGGTGTPAGSPTPTVTGTPPTATPTATGGASGQIVPRANLITGLSEDFGAETLAAGTSDSWTMEIVGDQSMYVYAIAPPSANLVLSVIKDGETIVNRQNTAPAGLPEFLNAPTLAGDGTYEIHVTTDSGQSTEYAITAYTEPEFPIIFSGFLESGSPHSGVQLAADAIHYWFFSASEGDILTISVDPVEAVDPYIEIFEPGGSFLDFLDDGEDGDSETGEFTLSTAGMYAIGVTDIVSRPMTYSLEITLE